jgi:hypothetical protein
VDELDALLARIIVFFELPDLTFQLANDSPPYYSGSGLYAIVASVQKSLYSVSQSADRNKINQRCHQSTCEARCHHPLLMEGHNHRASMDVY